MFGSVNVWAGGWGVAPPFTATQGASITGASAWGNTIAGNTTNYLVEWYQDPNGVWHGVNVIGGGGGPAPGYRMPTSGYFNLAPFTVSLAGNYTVAVYVSTSSSLSGSPTGSQQASQTISVSAATTPTTFVFSNLSYTYDGTVKTATVTPNPGNATYTANLTGGPAPGTYSVTATANGSFSGSGSATLTIDSAPANTAPTIHWNFNLYQPFPTDWYQVAQAMAHDDDNNIMQVQVDYLEDIGNATNGWTAFAYNGVSPADIAAGNYHDISSDPNYAYQGYVAGGKAHLFRARAIDSAGASSAYIYLLVKPWGSAFTVDDLPVEAGNHRFFPNAICHQINSRVLGQVIQSLPGKNGYTIWFKDGTHEFDSSWGRYSIHSWDQTDANGFNTWVGVHNSEDEAAKVEVFPGAPIADRYVYNPGSLGTISGCANITFQAETVRGAVFHWASYSSTGVTTIPTAAKLFTENPVLSDPARQDWYTRPVGLYSYNNTMITDGPRPWPLPGAFIGVAGDCDNIRFVGLKFDANYRLDPYRFQSNDAGRADNGRHLEIAASNTNVINCTFAHAPGWSLVVGNASAPPNNVHLDANEFYDNSGDALNIQQANNSYFVGNIFSGNGDDAISIAGDNNHVLSNTITRSGWRGILAYNLTNSEIRDNTISFTASTGISFSPVEADSPQLAAQSKNVLVTYNIATGFTGIGAWPDHNTGNSPTGGSLPNFSFGPNTSNITVQPHN